MYFFVYYHQILIINLSICPKPSCQVTSYNLMRPLKFKQIRKSIIAHKQSLPTEISSNKSPLKRNLFGQGDDTEMSFKSIKQSTMSPLKPVDMNTQAHQISTNKKNKFLFEESSAQRLNLSPLSNKKRVSEMERSKGIYTFDSDRKVMQYQRVTSNFGSEQKENSKSSIYFNQENKENFVYDCPIKLNFAQQKERKLNTGRKNVNEPSDRQNPAISQIYEASKNSNPGSLSKKNSGGMLFKTALQTSNKKKTLRSNLDSDRQTGRESSIGKLKQRLFGMKRVISQKENKPLNQIPANEGEETKSFTIYTTHVINPKSSAKVYEKGAQGQRLSTLGVTRRQTLERQDQNVSFSNVVVASINKGMQKPAFKHFLNVEDRFIKQNCFTKPQLNDSRFDSVNISLVESCDSILDMSPNL